ILGTAQSGHIMAVGFDLYCQLLKQAGGQLKGQKPRLRVGVDVGLDFVVTKEAEVIAPPAKDNGFSTPRKFCVGKTPLSERIPPFIPVAYVSDPAMRIRSYREIAEITSREQFERHAANGVIVSEHFRLPLIICSGWLRSNLPRQSQAWAVWKCASAK